MDLIERLEALKETASYGIMTQETADEFDRTIKYAKKLDKEKADAHGKLKVCLINIEDCLDEAPVDFLGTGSNSSAADREEREWRKKYKSNFTKAEEIIKEQSC